MVAECDELPTGARGMINVDRSVVVPSAAANAGMHAKRQRPVMSKRQMVILFMMRVLHRISPHLHAGIYAATPGSGDGSWFLRFEMRDSNRSFSGFMHQTAFLEKNGGDIPRPLKGVQ
jgi:hypothetical protein